MTVPFYVPPEQLMKDRAEYARKGIARGKSIAAVEYADGILLVAENPSGTLHKIGEIYDRIAFAGAGKYSEFETLRVAGIRHADLKGYSYARTDVTAKSLANAYSHALGQIFTQEVKPYEVGIMLAEVGDTTAEQPALQDHLRRHPARPRTTWRSSAARRSSSTASLRQSYRPEAPLAEAVQWAVAAFQTAAARDLRAQRVGGGGGRPDSGAEGLPPAGGGRDGRRLEEALQQAPGQRAPSRARRHHRPPALPAPPAADSSADRSGARSSPPGTTASSSIARASSSSGRRHPDLGGGHARRR